MIDDRDQEITLREQLILEQKRKTQELEKFKYVLDYKIQELKIQRGPKEQEIMNLKITTHSMDDEMMHFNKINTALGGIVDNLKNKQAEFHHANHVNRLQVRRNESYIQGFKTAVYWVA